MPFKKKLILKGARFRKLLSLIKDYHVIRLSNFCAASQGIIGSARLSSLYQESSRPCHSKRSLERNEEHNGNSDKRIPALDPDIPDYQVMSEGSIFQTSYSGEVSPRRWRTFTGIRVSKQRCNMALLFRLS